MRSPIWVSLAPVALLLAGFTACQSSSSKTPGTSSGKRCGLTVLYQNNNNGEIEPCG